MKALLLLPLLLLPSCAPIGTANPLDRVEYDQPVPGGAYVLANPGAPPPVVIPIVCPRP